MFLLAVTIMLNAPLFMMNHMTLSGTNATPFRSTMAWFYYNFQFYGYFLQAIMNFLFALILLITYYYTEGTDSSGDKNYRKDKS
jgi:uncharacterized membrane protein